MCQQKSKLQRTKILPEGRSEGWSKDIHPSWFFFRFLGFKTMVQSGWLLFGSDQWKCWERLIFPFCKITFDIKSVPFKMIRDGPEVI